jgi:hypothetical protein
MESDETSREQRWQAWEDEANTPIVEKRRHMLDARVHQLGYLANRMRLMGLCVTGLTVSNLLLLLIFLSLLGRIVPDVAMAVLMALTTASLASLTLYISLRSKAQVLFEEVSEELQWFIGREQYQHVSSKSDLPPPAFKPDLSTRIVLRTFARATDLLFFAGSSGPGVYFLLSFAPPLIWYAFGGRKLF